MHIYVVLTNHVRLFEEINEKITKKVQNQSMKSLSTDYRGYFDEIPVDLLRESIVGIEFSLFNRQSI